MEIKVRIITLETVFDFTSNYGSSSVSGTLETNDIATIKAYCSQFNGGTNTYATVYKNPTKTFFIPCLVYWGTKAYYYYSRVVGVYWGNNTILLSITLGGYYLGIIKLYGTIGTWSYKMLG